MATRSERDSNLTALVLVLIVLVALALGFLLFNMQQEERQVFELRLGDAEITGTVDE